ncbi:hypothetical protein [Streptomyces sp. NK15101]|uniref:hypothetical protein n=1 Tax=Streptomyces sp. NK15101 TaxID=2873261 RepID=UPI001CED3AF8|nr:hypothetical protein [Streptomyces sp. NK15101]
MTKNVRIGAALVGGYLLGRTRKARLALGFGLFLAGRRLDLDPRRIGRALAASPLVGGLNDQVRKELVEATKSAATEALTKRAEGLADSLNRRTRALGGSGEALGDERDEEAPEDDPEERDEPDASDERDDGEKGKPRRAARSQAPAKKATGRAKPADGTGKPAATARKRTAAKKTATPAGRRTRGGGDRG